MSFADPELSYPARLAMDKQSPLKLKGEAWEISTAEFRWERPVRLAEHVMRLKEGKGFEHHRGNLKVSAEKQTDDRVSMLIGTDLFLFRLVVSRGFSFVFAAHIGCRCGSLLFG